MICLEGATRNTALIAQMKEIGANLLLAEHIGRTQVVGRKPADCLDVDIPGPLRADTPARSPQRLHPRRRSRSVQRSLARRALEGCGDLAGVPCMIIAVDDVFVVPIPTMMKAVGFFQAVGNALIAPGSRDDVARRLATGTSGWGAVATGANGSVGVVPDAGSEHNAIEGALADCNRHDYGCHVIAIGPFSVVAAEVGKTP